MKNSFSVIGLMSGTSLDGLDVAWCFFLKKDDRWLFEIKKAFTVEYPKELKTALSEAHYFSGNDLAKLNIDLGRYYGKVVNEFIIRNEIEFFDFVASHGHTIFHQPQQGYTVQIGCPITLAAVARTMVIADFRTLDVALGGQGAPLVPIGDKLLFANYAACLNLGGFANVSMDIEGKRVAWDICPVNFVMNYYALQKRMPYDENGELARKGKINFPLLEKLESLPFYDDPYPKSLGREWVEEYVFPLIDSFGLSIEEVLATVVEHVALRIAFDLKEISGNVLVTGGGTFNSFLLDRMKELCNCCFVDSQPGIIDFKEALIFAFLGVLKARGEINVLSSVTGASRDSCSGVVCEL